MALYFGSGKRIKITFRNSVCTPYVVQQKIPVEYVRVSYIQTDGNQYIDTGVMASDYQDGIQYIFKGQCTELHSTKNNNYLFGCLADNQRSCNPSYGKDGNFHVMIGGSGETAFGKTKVDLNVDFIFRAKGASKDLSSFSATYNDLALKQYTLVNSNMPSANIYLLAANINGSYTSSSSSPFIGRLYGFTMLDMSGTTIRNYIPCYRSSDGEIGLYDTVYSEFYENSGTGQFTCSTTDGVQLLSSDGYLLSDIIWRQNINCLIRQVK